MDSCTYAYPGEVHHCPPQAVAPQTIFLAASGMFAVGSTKAGFCPPSSRRIGVRFFAAASMTILPTLTLPVKKMKSNGSLRSSVTSSLLPETAVTARGSKYFGTRSNKTLLVAGKPSESFRMQGLPAAITWTAGSKSSVKGPLKGPITRATPYGSRYTLAVCPLSRRALGTTTSMGFIHSFNSAFAKAAVPTGAMISKTFSWLAVLKSLLIAASRPSEFSLHKFSRRVSWSIRHSYDLVASESKYAFCLLKISWNEFIQVSLWDVDLCSVLPQAFKLV